MSEGKKTISATQPKPSKWRYVFVVLGVLQILGLMLIALAWIWALQQANAGVYEAGFINLFIFAVCVPCAGVLALVNIVGLSIYLFKQKPQGKGLVLGIVSLMISLSLVIGAATIVYLLQTSANEYQASSDRLQQRLADEEKRFQADNAKPEITKEEAVQLLQSCQLRGFYYTSQTSKDNGEWGDLSSTGVVLTRINGQPNRISIADRLIPELVPVAREAQKMCNGQPQFWHDGLYE